MSRCWDLIAFRLEVFLARFSWRCQARIDGRKLRELRDRYEQPRVSEIVANPFTVEDIEAAEEARRWGWIPGVIEELRSLPEVDPVRRLA